MAIKSKSEIISHILTPAIKFWLRSQLQNVVDLTIEINAGDKQILTGKIDQVSLQTNKAIYQGIHVSKAVVNTEKIAINLGGILRGKPLKLLQPIFVNGELVLTLDDLKTSLDSRLLHQGLIDLLHLLLEHQKIEEYKEILAQYEFNWRDIILLDNQFILQGILSNNQGEKSNLILISSLTLKDDHTLLFNPIKIEGISDLDTLIINNFEVDLGKDVELQQLILNSDKLSCVGKIKVISE
ncbi:MAG: DUF2993 domain-containing protein [Cyanobacteria bacterium]|nr:DUF2993 domain-containing protein [Cyanobacteria bacterium CG_2015-16_32_12]NCO79371.1 DUF2993 domain-containing protein [Cyanobacteria bacterium CG_2015-22_32_23]NCQ05461.1 DUF2993 domain-containing protein [Cyanobacteria bacterium CG_2015-09_32_10]NCQ41389.1 DUF2993 domain-containing protein [Cyanobacteria bacterium CG_2015-04_32_10]NCS85645.1 DUF2993 domain-containing protein [Cyanobacteria bacterium CG_2015-02_32_10]